MAGEIKVTTLFGYDLAQLNSLPDEFEFFIRDEDLAGLSLSLGMERVRLLRGLMESLHALQYRSTITEDRSENVYRYHFKRRKALLPANPNPDAIDI